MSPRITVSQILALMAIWTAVLYSVLGKPDPGEARATAPMAACAPNV